MKRLVLISGAFALWTVLLTSCYMATKIKDIEIKKRCKTIYTYTDFNGNKAISEHCFIQEGIYICRDIKHVKKALKVEKKEVCE